RARMRCHPIAGRARVRVWRVGEEMLGGPFVVYAVILEPTWDGPRESVRELSVDPATGEIVLDALPEPAVVRVAIGFTKNGAFVPVAHSPALETEPRGGALLQWTLE